MEKNHHLHRTVLNQRARVRLEFTALPRDRAMTYVTDKKLTALRVLLTERFGLKALNTFEEWMLTVAIEQASAEEAQGWGGPEDAA